MWYNQPTYISYSPYGYGYVNSGDPYARAPRERTSRGRDAAAYHPHWQQTQGAAQYPYNSYLSGGEGSFVSYPYQSHAYDYNPYVHEDTNRRQVREQERQLELARQADLNRKREEERTYKPQEQASTSTPHFSIPISSPGKTSPDSRRGKRTQATRYPSPPPSPKPVTPEATPEQIRAAMTIQEFYRKRMARQQALASIAELSTQFEQFKSAFSPPSRLDYRGAAAHDTITIPVSSESFVRASLIPPYSEDGEDAPKASESSPALAFTSNNKAVHEYIENLNRLLVQLDRVESGGHTLVREQRKQMIRDVEAEAQRMDRWIEAVWNSAQPAQPEPQSSRRLRQQPTMEDVFDN